MDWKMAHLKMRLTIDSPSLGMYIGRTKQKSYAATNVNELHLTKFQAQTNTYQDAISSIHSLQKSVTTLFELTSMTTSTNEWPPCVGTPTCEMQTWKCECIKWMVETLLVLKNSAVYIIVIRKKKLKHLTQTFEYQVNISQVTCRSFFGQGLTLSRII